MSRAASRGLLLVCAAGVIWGTIGLAVQLVHDRSELDPWTISAYRTMAALIVLSVVTGARGKLAASWVLTRTRWPRVVTVGLLTAAFQLFFFVSVIAVGVSIATVVCLGFAPVLLLALDALRRRRRPSRARLLTVALAITGLLLVSLLGGGPSDQLSRPVLGILTALASGAAFAISADVAAPLTQTDDALTVTTATMTIAALVLVPGGLLLARQQGSPLTTTDLGSWVLMVYLGVVTMAIAYALLYAGLRTTSSGTAMVATLLEPVTAVVLAAWILHERLTSFGLLGCVMIVAAIATLGRSHDPQPQ